MTGDNGFRQMPGVLKMAHDKSFKHSLGDRISYYLFDRWFKYSEDEIEAARTKAKVEYNALR